MKKALSIPFQAAMLLLLLSSCGGSDGPGPEIHDSKYLLIDSAGQPVDGPATENYCILDQYIGLTWELKSDAPGLRDWRNTYSWYSPDESFKGELDYRGIAGGGTCTGSACDTSAYAAAVNVTNYCGHNDWRIPTRDELGSISDPRKQKNPPTTNMNFFPYMQAEEYWSSNDYQFQYDTAWRWNYKLGHDRVEWKATPAKVRLVRGVPGLLQRVKE